MTKTRKFDKDKLPWREFLNDSKAYLQRKQEEHEAAKQIRDAKRLIEEADEGEEQ